MRPSSGAYSPQRSFTSVDLPAPFWPTRTCTSPRRMARSTRSSASTPGNRLVVPWSSTMASAGGLPGSVTVPRGDERTRRSRSDPPRRAPALHEVLRGDELHRRLDPALEVLALLDAEAG